MSSMSTSGAQSRKGRKRANPPVNVASTVPVERQVSTSLVSSVVSSSLVSSVVLSSLVSSVVLVVEDSSQKTVGVRCRRRR